MNRTIRISALLSLLLLASITAFAFHPLDAKTMFQRATQLATDGNFQEAADVFRLVISDSETPGDLVAKAMEELQQCAQNLRGTSEMDADLELAIRLHGKDYRVLAQAAETISTLEHYGSVVDQAFTRGRGVLSRGQGAFINVGEQDRLRALQWLGMAIEAAKESGLAENSDEVAGLNLALAKTLLTGREGMMAWRLQSKTDLQATPDYTDLEDQGFFSAQSAPVDAEGNPVYHKVPASFQDAASDGERLRWALTRAQLAPMYTNKAKLVWGEFLQSQFSVDTLQQSLWLNLDLPAEPAEDGVFALHTLKENETIAKLASGIKRFDVPDEFNPIRVFEDLSAADEVAESERAAWQLVQTFLNRRQYPKAAELLRDFLKRFAGENDSTHGWQRRQ